MLQTSYKDAYLHPTASISINKNKLRSYNGNFYLRDKQEFEIELFNPTDKTVLAKISMNGKPISTAGIVLKPGQRAYLERFLDTPKRFAFETYTIDSTDSQALAAIMQNGDVTVDFYNEQEVHVSYVNSYNDNGVKYRSMNLSNVGTVNSYHSAVDTLTASKSMEWMDMATEEKFRETGRIEQGSNSNQRFEHYGGKFNSWISTTVRLKLLPYSAKPIEVQDLAQYCTECGTRNKKGIYKYCPTCGTKF